MNKKEVKAIIIKSLENNRSELFDESGCSVKCIEESTFDWVANEIINEMNDFVRPKAFDILAEHGAKCTVAELEEHFDDPKAVLKLSYCLEAIEAALLLP